MADRDSAARPVVTPAGPGSVLSVALTGPQPADPGASERAAGPVAEELVRRWLLGRRSVHTRKAYGRDLALWLAWCAQLVADPLTVERPGWETVGVSRSHVDTWARAMQAAGAPASSIARRLSAVSSWYGWLRREQYLEISPVADVDRPVVDRDTSTTPGLTRDQAAALLAAGDTDRHPLQARTAAVAAVLLFTGCRIGELLAADLDDLGHDRGHRTLTVTRKGGKRQALVLPPPAAARLDAYLTWRAEHADLREDQTEQAELAELAGVDRLAELAGAVSGLAGVPGATAPGRPLIATGSGRRMDAGAVWRLLRRLARTTPILTPLAARMSAHVLRHSYATLSLDAGATLRDLQDALGHADPRTTRRYDRSRRQLDRSPGYTLTAYLAGGAG